MTPIKFKQCNRVYGEGQPEYLPLPALAVGDDNDTVITCWQLTFRERLKVLFSGRFWFSMLNFRRPLTPILPSVDQPFKETV